MIESILAARDVLRWRNQAPHQCGFYVARVSRREATALRRELGERRAPRGKTASRVAVAPGDTLVAIIQDVAVLTKRRVRADVVSQRRPMIPSAHD